MGRGFIHGDPLVRGSGATGKSEKVVGPFSTAVFWFIATCLSPPPDGDPLDAEVSTELRTSWYMIFFRNGIIAHEKR